MEYLTYFKQFDEKKLQKQIIINLLDGLNLGTTKKQLLQIYDRFELFDELDVHGFVWMIWVIKNKAVLNEPSVQEWMLSNGKAEEVINVQLQGKDVQMSFQEFKQIMNLEQMEKKNLVGK